MSTDSRRSRTTSASSEDEPPALSRTEMLRAARGFTAAMNLEATTPEQRRGFAVKGSVAMLAHGVDVTPGDIDALVGNMPQAQRATRQMGYTTRPSPFRQRLPREDALPQMDVLHA